MQRWFTKRCWLLLSLLNTACARPQFIAPLKGVQTGPYHVYNCGMHAAEVSILINTLLSTLQPAIVDVSKQESSAAYTTFFKHVSLAPIVRDILSNITQGVPTTPGPHAIRNAAPDLFGPPTTPQFLCITDYNQMTWSLEEGGQGGKQFDAYTACTQSPVNAYGVFGTKFLENSIVLCPSFWAYPGLPPSSKAACLPVDPHFNRFRDRGTRLVNYQIWVLLHELAISYIYARSGSLLGVSTANDCQLLAASNAVDNAMSYVYYVANIRLGCTNFPRNGRSAHDGTIPIHQGSVELLEIDTNTTLIGGSESRNVSSYGGQSIGNSSVGNIVGQSNVVALAPWPT